MSDPAVDVAGVARNARANANPSKSFFITMLTRDIDLSDCILDLLDNSVDGIGEAARRAGGEMPEDSSLAGFKVEIDFDERTFSIADASGGIPLAVAKDYAFRFGRPDDAPPLDDGTIGLYGIGLKRAMFKMGNHVLLRTRTVDEAFTLDLDVDEWRRDPQLVNDELPPVDVGEQDEEREAIEWHFDLTGVETGRFDDVGTNIIIDQLYPTISRQFESPAFRERINRIIARDYAFILSRGLEVVVNGVAIAGAMPSFRTSAAISPFQYLVERDGVKIEITAGLADPPPDDVSATASNPESGAYGWYVVCNDRVVVSADKSSETGWGVRPVPAWHPQYTGFMGVARFSSDDPNKLPWKTTKRDVESSNEFFQFALPVMSRATKRFTDYTNARQAEAKRLKRLERAATKTSVARVSVNAPFRFPEIKKKGTVTISYARPADDVAAAAQALGILGSSPSEVGIRTFEYYLEREADL